VPAPLTRSSPGTADPLGPLLDLAGVADSFATARQAIDRLLAHRVLRLQSAVVSSESALRGARASAALAGAEVDLPHLRAGAVDDPIVQGALRITAGLGELVPVWERAPLQALARLHVLAAAGTAPPDQLGRPSGDPVVAGRLTSLAGLLTGGTRVSGILLAAVVQGELLALTPFGTADGLVARAAARLTLVSRGVDPKAVGVPEVGHLELAEGYRHGSAGYATGSPEGVSAWVCHCASAVELGAREGLGVCEAVLRG
jgi:hypothetical protein